MTTLLDWQALSPQEKVDAIKPLWLDGKSASEISANFRNCSRNSIIGAINRAKLRDEQRTKKPKDTRIKPERKIRLPIAVAKVAIIERLPEPDPDSSSARVAFMINNNRPPLPGHMPQPMTALPNKAGVMCRFPVQGGWCGASSGEKMYCEAHQEIMYRPAEKLRVPKGVR